ncbi:MAG TPA: prepilin-type cleavage/methylation domain-containing protein [Vibrio sp.]|uniref:pilin n=1 Tax=Vibrio sp. TaxID=678 RepID=UPI000ECE1CD5|nr:pilin [Vibrio sp.]HCH03096.1 prepilin-type cleavage/methylation domain-containing protein [Vibrio sp.]
MKQLQQGKKKLQKGFTLIELMIVVAIIGVLSAIAIPAYQNYVKKSEAATGLSTVRSLVTNVDMYQQENGVFPVAGDLNKLGASKDMNSLGELAVAQTASGASGTITFIYGSSSSIDGATVTLSKDSAGWKCAFKKDSGGKLGTDDLPKSCETLNN